MAKPRSPVLGFNHNVRHIGWLFHVQTEDSGVSNPHIFTHLFHDGVILASKKMVYDANSSVDVVKGLMQAQHKSVLRELKGGAYDPKIRQYLGAPPGDTDYDDMTVEAAEAAIAQTPAPTLTPPPAVQPMTTVGAVADLSQATTLPTPATQANVPSATDVSAAFRAISHASAQMNVARAPGSKTNPPPVAGKEESELVFAPPPAAPPPPGSGVWSAKPQISQERPFEKGSGSFPSMSSEVGRRTVPPPMADGPEQVARGKVATTGRPSGAHERQRPPTIPPGGAPAAKPATIPPGGPPPRTAGGPPTNRPAGAPPTATGSGGVAAPPQAAGRPGGATTRFTGAPPVGGAPRSTQPPPVSNAPAPRPPMVQSAARPPMAGPGAGTNPPSRPVAPTRQGGAAPGTQPPAGAPPRQSGSGSPSVIVQRPAVIVGAPPQVVSGQQRKAGTGPREAVAVPPSDSIFGKDLISEKSLDEVIMAYLSEDANEE